MDAGKADGAFVVGDADGASIVGEESLLSGQIVGKDLVVLGRFEGSIEISGRFRIGKQGHARAQVRSSRVDVEGEFEGEIVAGLLVLGETARARGLFRVERLNMREGAVLNGTVNPPAAPKAAPDGPKLSPPDQTSVASEIERWEEEGGRTAFPSGAAGNSVMIRGQVRENERGL